jgi:hypothetical protein
MSYLVLAVLQKGKSCELNEISGMVIWFPSYAEDKPK